MYVTKQRLEQCPIVKQIGITVSRRFLAEAVISFHPG